MKRVLLIVMLIAIYPTLTLAKVPERTARLQATTAALVLQSLQLGEQSQQLFSIKDSLLEKVRAKEGNLGTQEDFIVDVATELKYIATVAYFEGNLLGAVLALKEEYKLQYINNRILELDNAIRNTISSLKPIQVAYSAIKDSEALQQIARSIKTTHSLIQMYRNSIEILQKMATKKMEEQEQIKP